MTNSNNEAVVAGIRSQFKAGLELLAARPESQIAILPAFVSVVDEIVRAICDPLDMARDYGIQAVFSVEELRDIRTLELAVKHLRDDTTLSLESLLTTKEWQEARTIAVRYLSLHGDHFDRMDTAQ